MRRTLLTACPLDCPDTCSLDVVVEDGRLLAVDAAPPERAVNPFTQGFICQKVKHHAARVHGPDRVLTPLLRTGPKGAGEFRPATWDEALDVVTTRLRTAAAGPGGPATVVPYLYNSSAGLLGAATRGLAFWARMQASIVPHTICAATTNAARRSVLGTMASADPFDVVHARLVVVWGANPSVSNTHFPPLVTRAVREQGAKVVVIDPRRTGMAKRADLHLAVRPGTDAVLAMAVARQLRQLGAVDGGFAAVHLDGVEAFLESCEPWTMDAAGDACGVPAASIEALALVLATTHPCFLRLGWGPERNRNGGDAIRAILALRLLAGGFGVPGAGIMFGLGAARPFDTAASLGGVPPVGPRREVNQNRLGAMLVDGTLDPPIRVLFVQGANPAVSNPDQATVLRGLARDDLFTVVHDQVLTDTARFADVVLPATTHFEADDAAGSYGTFTIQRMPAVIDRVGESRTNDEVYAGLAARLGWDGFSPEPAFRLAAGLGAVGGRPPGVFRAPGATVQFRDVHVDLPGGRARLHPCSSRPVVPAIPTVPTGGDRDPMDPFPLALLSPASHRTINSIFGEAVTAIPTLAMHADDAAARGLVDGQRVQVWNDAATLVLPLRIDADTRPGVVVVPKGVWARAYGAENGGRTVNALTPATLSDLGAGACFNDARVEVAALPT